jgi:ribosomal-protein-serine acetyltransferase
MFAHEIDADTSLTLLEDRHGDELFALTDRNRSHLREWLPWLDRIRTPADTRAFIRASLAQLAEGNGFQAGVVRRGRLAGVIGLHYVQRLHRTTGIGYWLGAEYQGRGLMTRSCATVLDHVFGALGLNLAEIQCATANRRSCAIPERLGFTREGTLRQREWLYDHFVDHAVFSMQAREWQQRRGG